MASKRILFLVNGYGLGNSSRVHGIIQHLSQKCEIDILAYGNSLEYFKQVPEVGNVFSGLSLEYGTKKGEINFFAMLGKVFKNIHSLYKGRKQIKEILKFHHYNLIVSDSNYSPVFLRKRPKMISINNADVIVSKAAKINKKDYRTQYLMEWLDHTYNSLVPDLIISPFFELCKDTKKIQHVPLIVRKEFLRSCLPPGALSPKRHHVFVMTGGAEALNHGISIDHKEDSYDLSVLGDQIQISGKTQRENKTFNASHLMKQATIVVINGGFSSISEALAMAKPMIVIPLKGHMEQKINALWVQENHLGVVSSWENLENSITHVIENYEQFLKPLLNYEMLNGAEQAADLIMKQIEDDSQN